MAAKATLQKVLTRFETRKVMTVAELARQMRCSSRTVHRRLQVWQAIHSYNQNGHTTCCPRFPLSIPTVYGGIGTSGSPDTAT